MTSDAPDPFELHSLRHHFRLADSEANAKHAWYDIKAYPYSKDAIFAAVGQNQTIVFSPAKDESGKDSIEIIAAFEDEEDTSLNSCTWAQDQNTGNPLICVSGGVSTIKVLDVYEKKLARTLAGSGEAIQDLATSPLNSMVIASCGMDRDVRIWTLDYLHIRQPMLLICRGHREGVMSIAWHSSGRYLLSGGKDNTINLWVIPELPDTTAGRDSIPVLQYPHFSTSAIHSDWIDCLMFHHDLIISKAARAPIIVLWMINGFNSKQPVPDKYCAPTDREAQTRSAFAQEVCFQRLLQFKIPETNYYWMRFGLFHHAAKHPLLVMGNSVGRLFFWDLERLEHWKDPSEADLNSAKASSFRDDSVPPPPSMTTRAAGTRTRPISIASSVSSFHQEPLARGRQSPMRERTTTVPPSDLQDQFAELKAHKEIKIPKERFDVRQVAFSPEGEWVAAAGDNGMIVLFSRWGA
ncbi:MAG: hypothetical protein M1814_001642 [Vezdaea aestivalis]|nr:MAG: hypothetical protein M1814_001642 [Vezdaea aestivalis]